ncbi:HIT family protein [bacterium]|nr:HIT family protein [bacterium]|tara:strand:- start:775 stop:1176 length:402 start_codon:yes stop_codon:yes gene_type:complete
MRDLNNPCLFCNITKKEIIFENDLSLATLDTYPVSKYHSLIIPKRHIKSYFDLTYDELISCHDLLLKVKNKINSEDSTVGGFNVGSNSSKPAGQSIFHCHIHLIPRRLGDIDNPQGGVRSVIPSKQHYLSKSK